MLFLYSKSESAICIHGKDWGQEEKETTEDEMVRWYHRLNGHGFGWTLGVGDGQGGLACCGSWGRKELDTTDWLNWTELNWYMYLLSLDLPCYLPITLKIFKKDSFQIEEKCSSNSYTFLWIICVIYLICMKYMFITELSYISCD